MNDQLSFRAKAKMFGAILKLIGVIIFVVCFGLTILFSLLRWSVAEITYGLVAGIVWIIIGVFFEKVAE